MHNHGFKFKKFDMYGRNINLTHDEEDRFKTEFGAFITSLIIALLVLIVSLSIYSIYTGQEYHINQHKIFSPVQYDQIQHNNETDLLGIGFRYEDQDIINDYDILAGYMVNNQFVQTNTVFECSSYMYEVVERTQFYQGISQFKFFCANFDRFDKIHSSFPLLRISQKLNVTSKRISELRNEVIPYYVAAKFEDINLFEKNEQIRSHINLKLLESNVINGRKINAKMSWANVLINKGLLFSKTNESWHKVFESISTDILYNSRTMLEIAIETNPSVLYKTEKNYISIFAQLAFIGGITKALFLLGFLIVYPFRELWYYRKLINSMFNVCMNEMQVNTAIKAFDKVNKSQGKLSSVILSGSNDNRKEEKDPEHSKKEEKIKEDEENIKNHRNNGVMKLRSIVLCEIPKNNNRSGLLDDLNSFPHSSPFQKVRHPSIKLPSPFMVEFYSNQSNPAVSHSSQSTLSLSLPLLRKG